MWMCIKLARCVKAGVLLLVEKQLENSKIINLFFFFLAQVIVKCNQNRKQSCLNTTDLSNENNLPFTLDNFAKGAQLLVNYKGKSYPVTFVSFNGLLLQCM